MSFWCRCYAVAFMATHIHSIRYTKSVTQRFMNFSCLVCVVYTKFWQWIKWEERKWDFGAGEFWMNWMNYGKTAPSPTVHLKRNVSMEKPQRAKVLLVPSNLCSAYFWKWSKKDTSNCMVFMLYLETMPEKRLLSSTRHLFYANFYTAWEFYACHLVVFAKPKQWTPFGSLLYWLSLPNCDEIYPFIEHTMTGCDAQIQPRRIAGTFNARLRT